ncbi:MAG: toll/interleukin-1 receptor domain-containing protein [Oscillospiraceae bacterium]|nr:toll/interleukin-1 receptor domain-containing protein [Oscillospiraceae bacterium]
MDGTNQYAAFISYRHLPVDRAIAERTQNLLERYKAPRNVNGLKERRIGRVFRDTSELPTSADLDVALQSALESSEFLIVILSKETKDSKWCMEEIRNFKEAHGGSINNILPILVDGEPSESIPDILRHETREIVKEDGTVELQEVEVEPLCCDVRAKSLKGSLKKLKKEYLRLCAAMLGVSFDDLYQRHARRRKRITTTIVSVSIALFLTVLLVVFFFMFFYYLLQLRYDHSLIDNHILSNERGVWLVKQGATEVIDGDYEKALMYYSESRNADGMLLLLQQHGWLNHVDDGNGWIDGDILFDSEMLHDYYEGIIHVTDSTGEKLLYENNGMFVIDGNGNVLEDLSYFGTHISASQDRSCWTFATDDTITFYFTADSSISQVPKPNAINPYCDSAQVENLLIDDDGVWNAMALNRTRAAVCYGGYLYVYDLSESDVQGTLRETFDLSQVFNTTAELMSAELSMWVDDGGELCVVSDGTSAAVFSIGSSEFSHMNSFYDSHLRALQNVAFSNDGQHYAFVYGNAVGTDYNPGGGIEVYDKYGNICMKTDFDGNTPLWYAAFEPNGSRIAAWGNGKLQIWDWTTGKEAAAPIQIANLEYVKWLEEGRLAVSDGYGNIRYYTIVRFKADDVPIESREFDGKQCERQDYKQTEVELSTGYRVKNDGYCISVTDGKENKDSLKIRYIFEIGCIDRMFVDKDRDVVYLWNSLGHDLIEVTVDENGEISSVFNVDTLGKRPIALFSTDTGGLLAEMETGDIFLYFTKKQTEPVRILQRETAGMIQSVASYHGRICFVIRNQRFTEENQLEYTYSIELYSSSYQGILTTVESESTEEITDLKFFSNWDLTYQYSYMYSYEPCTYIIYTLGDEVFTWLLDAPGWDSEAKNTLQNMSCYQLDDEDIQIVDAAFDPHALGNWGDYLHVVVDEGEKQ